MYGGVFGSCLSRCMVKPNLMTNISIWDTWSLFYCILYLYARKTASYAENIAVMPPYVYMVNPQPGVGGLVGLSVQTTPVALAWITLL